MLCNLHIVTQELIKSSFECNYMYRSAHMYKTNTYFYVNKLKCYNL